MAFDIDDMANYMINDIAETLGVSTELYMGLLGSDQVNILLKAVDTAMEYYKEGQSHA